MDAQLIKFIEKEVLGKSFKTEAANDDKIHKIVGYKFVEENDSVRMQSDWKFLPDIPWDKFEETFKKYYTPVDLKKPGTEVSIPEDNKKEVALSTDAGEFFSLAKTQLGAQGEEFKLLRDSLLESIQQVKKDKSFVPQAKAITDIADTMIKMRQTEISALQTLSDFIGK